MDAPSVGLEASEAGEHQDGEEKSQHGQAQRGVGDQGQRLKVTLQLLLMAKYSEGKGGEKTETVLVHSYHFKGGG